MGVGAGPLRGPGTCRRVGRGVSASGVTDMGEEEKRANGSWRGIGSSVEIRVPRPRRALPLSASFASARHCRELEMGLTMVEEFSCKIKSRAEPSRAEPSRAEPSRAEPSRAEPSRAEPSRAEPSRAEPSRAEPSRAEPSRAEPSRAEPSRAEPSRAEPSRAEPSRAEPSRAEPSRAEPSRAEPSRAEPSRAEPSRAEPSRAEPSRAEPFLCPSFERASATRSQDHPDLRLARLIQRGQGLSVDFDRAGLSVRRRGGVGI